MDYKIMRLGTYYIKVEIPSSLTEEQIKLLNEKLKKLYFPEPAIIVIRYYFSQKLTAEYVYSARGKYDKLEYFGPSSER